MPFELKFSKVQRLHKRLHKSVPKYSLLLKKHSPSPPQLDSLVRTLWATSSSSAAQDVAPIWQLKILLRERTQGAGAEIFEVIGIRFCCCGDLRVKQVRFVVRELVEVEDPWWWRGWGRRRRLEEEKEKEKKQQGAMSAQTGGARRLLYMAFNQDNSCLAIGSKDGYKIFSCDTCGCCYERSEGAISVVEMLFSTSLVALVGAGEQPALSPRRLSVFNTTSGTISAELNFVSSILGVRMNRKRLVVVLEKKTYIHELGQLTILDTIDTVSNPRGLCALSPNQENCYLALPASTSTGFVLVYDALDLHALCQIQAHKSPLAAMSFSSDGLLLATASDQGTVIRVHSIPQASKAYTFRRGSYPVTIYSLSFGPPSQIPQLLAASCSSGTIHVFKLGFWAEDSTGDVGQTSNRTAAGLLSAVIPGSMSDMVDSERCLVTIRNGSPANVRSHCAIAEHLDEAREHGAALSSPSNNRARIFVVTSSGFFHEWSITVAPGKESTCTLQREIALLSSGTSDEISAHFV